MHKSKSHLLFSAAVTSLILIINVVSISAQTIKQSLAVEAARGLALRSIGPAVMGGRIADIAVHPTNKNTWYVAVGSGGLWKTTNSGTTWKAIFDNQPSYSIGTVAVDPNNPEVIWVGTGENVSGRHVGWGDGVYKSLDGGRTWKKMGLSASEHIGKIVIDPRNSANVMVAAEGPLWSAGGERGFYRTTDGGQSWSRTLYVDENTGVTDIEIDPSNPEVVYAATYQRRRHTWALLAGGAGSGIYKSVDGGINWKALKTGLPNSDMGKIGLAVTPANPQLVYATIESDGANSGFYRSFDKGESWEKRNAYISGGTGPHYYQEIEASPTNADLVYQMDVFLHVTRDGGKNFDYLGTGREKHSDNHALWIDPANGNHLIAGTDGGLYESFDEGDTWRHFPNLPISQFYKIALDNSTPFYNVVAGAQDLGTLIGPSRTLNTEGIRNQDWYVPLGADGYDAAFDPIDPNTVYMEIQEGLLHRLDRKTNEVINIQPQPAAGENPERWNWDSPVLISPHNHKTLYFGSQRLWKSTNQGNSWTPISADLTTNKGRYEMKIYDRVQSIDALYDNSAMSKFATLTSIAESPLMEGLIYTGSDDGLIHRSDDSGENWIKLALPQVPALSFINDIEASPHDKNTVFAVADAHKLGDYTTHLYISTNKGKTWESISGDLPKNTPVWVIKQDPVEENLLFIGTEYGLYFSINKGINWLKLDLGVPTIAFRDVELHARDHDLVGATFGRGIYVLDDYSPLRELSKLDGKNALFPVRDAWWYVPNTPMQAKGMPSQGSTSFVSENPPFGAIFTYYLHEIPQTLKATRREKEKALDAKLLDIPLPSWEELSEEGKQQASTVMLLVSNAQNEAVRWIEGKAQKGVHRVNWDLRLPAPNPINLSVPAFQPPWASSPKGPLVAPGMYSVELFVLTDGKLESQGAKQVFEVKPVHYPENNYAEVASFQLKTSQLSRKTSAAARQLNEVQTKLTHIKAALLKTPSATAALFAQQALLSKQLVELRAMLQGDQARNAKDEPSSPSIMSRIGNVIYGHWETTLLPTQTQVENIKQAEREFEAYLVEAASYLNELHAFEQALEKAGAPYTPGRKME